MSFSFYFLLFIVYSFMGWIIEVVFTLFKDKTLVNRGFLMGPYCPIYGYGCILIILLLKRYLDDPVVLFIMSVIICSVLEYVTSFVMEKLFKARWWDYSDRKFNINGRICLETLVPFGVLGCLLMYVINPFLSGIIIEIPSTILNVIAILLLVVYLVDNVVSFSIITKIHISTKSMITDNTEEITRKVREYIADNSRFGKRLMKSFPNVKMLKRKLKKGKK
ncbi:MAG: putative ABC transporter permease [Bacilli bacterium]|mgnify:CR=1 FL=1|nr:putative ABC transporter permease [Bacilli bacterium]